MRYLSRQNPKKLSDKICLVRADLNVKNPEDSFRLRAIFPTIRFLTSAGVKVILLSHRGRPNGRFQKKESLRVVLPFLQKELGKITFLPQFNFSKIKSSVENAHSRSIFLLENLRFNAGEEKNSASFARQLATLGDIYVNDAFSASHRAHSSIARLPRLLPAYAGFQFEKEIKNLDAILHSQKKPFVIILGGAKASDKIPVIRHFLSRATVFLLTGVPANTFLKAKGLDIGASITEKSMIPTAKKLLKSKKITLPFDFIIHNDRILDIGSMSAKLFANHINKAKTILWNGPPGIFEDRRFAIGSGEIAKAIVDSRAFSIVGGGETTALIHKLGLENRFGFVSTGGGAMLEYLAGKKLPGIVALQ